VNRLRHPRVAIAPTPRGWAATMVADLDHLLVEQGHLEKKAAANALACLFKWPDRPSLQEPLSRLAREELVHFERVLRLLRERGSGFRAQRPSSYAPRLKQIVRRQDPGRLLDELLVGAVIEARSSERMGLLAAALASEQAASAQPRGARGATSGTGATSGSGPIAGSEADGRRAVALLYADLVAAEERHKDVYRELAETVVDPAIVAERWADVVAHEAAVMARVSTRCGLHAGWGGLVGTGDGAEGDGA